ncbi:hypothetical protein Tco_1319646 [Tanacetum coccineum]
MHILNWNHPSFLQYKTGAPKVRTRPYDPLSKALVKLFPIIPSFRMANGDTVFEHRAPVPENYVASWNSTGQPEEDLASLREILQENLGRLIASSGRLRVSDHQVVAISIVSSNVWVEDLTVPINVVRKSTVSLPSGPDVYGQSLEALLTRPAASESESHVPDAVSDKRTPLPSMQLCCSYVMVCLEMGLWTLPRVIGAISGTASADSIQWVVIGMPTVAVNAINEKLEWIAHHEVSDLGGGDSEIGGVGAGSQALFPKVGKKQGSHHDSLHPTDHQRLYLQGLFDSPPPEIFPNQMIAISSIVSHMLLPIQ